MALESPPTSEARDEPDAPAGHDAPTTDVAPRPFSLASLLDLNEEELAHPLSRSAPPEHRWEQLTIRLTPETGEAIPSELHRGAASEPPNAETELIPGLDQPGAVEVPVYLAGRALHELMLNTPLDSDVITAEPESEASVSPEPIATVTMEPAAPSTSRPSPAKPPAIAVTELRPPKHFPDPPAANFARTEGRNVLWPKRKPPLTPSVAPQECARCGAVVHGDTCTRCGHDTAVPAQAAGSGVWHDVLAAFLDSDSRALRTVGALVLAPGELTASFILGQRRRYFGPVAIAIVTLVAFAVISGLGSLRPRPDRALMIGSDRTAEVTAGVAGQAPVNLAIDTPPDLLRDVATALDYVPLLWLPLMAFAVVAVVAATRTYQRRDDYAELVFASHFTAWFVLWWGLAVPMLLLLAKFGLEYGAAWSGVSRISYLESGRISGLSGAWSSIRDLTIAPAFHSWLLAVGIAPWTVAAYRRAFESTWARAALAGTLVTLVVVLLLVPFA